KISLGGGSSAKEIIEWYNKTTEKQDWGEHRASPLISGEGKSFQIPKPAGPREFELVGIPLKEPGLHVIEVESPILGQALIESRAPMFVSTAALVTNLGVHFKKGRESSLVWVTNLDDGKPAGAADVSIYDYHGKELASVKADGAGIARFGNINYPCLEPTDEYGGYGDSKCQVFAFAKKGDDVSFVSSEWDQGIESYRFRVSTEYLNRQWGPVVAHTVLNRSLLQPGDKVEMKHVVREHTITGFRPLRAERLPKRAFIKHAGSDVTYTFPLKFDDKTGTALTSFQLPKDAGLGTYYVSLSNKKTLPKKETAENDPYDWTSVSTATFQVEEYRLPLMQGPVKIQGSPLIRPAKVTADLSASYLSSGPARELPVKVRTVLQNGYFQPDVPGGDEFSFFDTPMKAGITRDDTRATPEENFVDIQPLKLGKDGGAKAVIPKIPRITRIKQILIEMEYTDPNGEVKTTAGTLPVFPANYIVGMKSDSWYAQDGKVSAIGVITDPKGKIKANRPYVVEAFHTEYITHRRRLVGGFYSYDSKNLVRALGKVCEGKTDSLGRFKCEPDKLPPGAI
ncbi:MAG: MG2 domain-containing protein, partial [Bdellovibrionia bacterium]